LSSSDDGLTAATNVSGYRHIAFVVSDLDAGYQKLHDAGNIEILSEPVTMTTPRSIAGFRFVYFRDPEGNIIELNELPVGA
jgi:glyoxylase I family protein